MVHHTNTHNQHRLLTALATGANPTVTARRMALYALLFEGRPVTKELIWQRLAPAVGSSCWGNHPQGRLRRDLRALRRAGLRIGYSRTSSLEGYYLKYPAFENPHKLRGESPTPQILIDAIRKMPIEKKLASAFAMADFALQQKRLLLSRQHPTLSSEEIDKRARTFVFGKHQL